MILALSSLVLPAAAMASGLPSGWDVWTDSGAFTITSDAAPDAGGRPASAVVVGWPAYTDSQTGWAGTVSMTLQLPAGGGARFEVDVADDCPGPTVGYHFATIAVDGSKVWDRDVGGASSGPERVSVDLPRAGETVEVVLGLEERQAVSNYPVRVWFIGPRLVTSDGAIELLPAPAVDGDEALPPDRPIRSAPVRGRAWTSRARVCGVWAVTQWDSVVNAEERAPWLAEEFGLDTIIFLPPESHNTLVGEQHRLTEEQFAAALRTYREAGFRILIYSSLTHLGHGPEWMDGTLARDRPGWLQRGPEGETLNLWGSDWLCPNTGALVYSLERTRRLVRAYEPDGVMLDCHSFHHTQNGMSCYCDGCQAAFREYLSERFGRHVLGRPTRYTRIPKAQGPLYALWLHWRNRVWAHVTERLRRELRRTQPGLVLLSNTQYLYQSPALAQDGEYLHEDVVLSESRGMSMPLMVAKLMLGRALAGGRPIWNYLGTFREDDLTRLLDPETVSWNVSTAYACGTRPWVVYYGFFEHPDDAVNADALSRLGTTLVWHNAHDPADRSLRPYAPILSVMSIASRNARNNALIPPGFIELRRRGVAAWLIEEEHVTRKALAGARVVVIEEGSSLSHAAAQRIAKWVRSGGRLIAASGTGAYDELGRLRSRGSMAAALGIEAYGRAPLQIGRGTAESLQGYGSTDELVEALGEYRFHTDPEVDVEVVGWLEGDRLVAYVCGEGQLPASLRLHPPEGLSGEALLCSPDRREPVLGSAGD